MACQDHSWFRSVAQTSVIWCSARAREGAAGLSLITNAGGAVAVSVTVLLTPEEMDAAAQLSPDYRPPGS